VTGGPTSPRLLRVEPPPIGPGSNPPPLSEGGGRWPTAAATQPGSSHRQSGLDPLDPSPMPRTRSNCCHSGLDLCHRLRRWGRDGEGLQPPPLVIDGGGRKPTIVIRWGMEQPSPDGGWSSLHRHRLRSSDCHSSIDSGHLRCQRWGGRRPTAAARSARG
jgi:hypothetical protein